MGLNEFVGKLSVEMEDRDLQDAILTMDKELVNWLCKVRYRRQITEANCKKERLDVIKMFNGLESAFSSVARVNKSIHISNNSRIISYR